MLQYDDSAFCYFALSCISVCLVPSWYSILSRVCSALSVKDADIGAVSRTLPEKAKATHLRKEFSGINVLTKKGFLVNLAITVCMTILFVWLMMSVNHAKGQVQSFDPFSILEIDSSAEENAIARAYHILALKYHPDKNPNNPAAEAKFMMVTKAKEALTDKTARENWEKYGNPDGKQSLAVSIGLPTFLLDPSNRNLVLVGYLIFVVGFIPFCVWTYYSDSSKFGEKDVMYDSYSWFHYYLNEHSILKSLPEALAGAAEFRQRNMPKSVEEKEEIAQLMSMVRSQMQKPKINHPVCVKGNVLLHAHLLDKKDMSPKCTDDLHYMLRRSTALLDAMISVCQHQDWLKTAMNCIEFGQYLTQGMWVKDSHLLQLPHFTAEEAKHCEKGKGKATTVLQYKEIPDDQKKGMVNFTDVQKKDVADYLRMFPDVEVTSKVFVDDDEDDAVYEGDLCTIRVTITRKHLAEGEKAGLVHAPNFPFPRQEVWWVILGTNDGKTIAMDKVGNPNRVVEHDIKFMAPREGEYEFDLYVKSNAYLGVDQQQKVTLKTLDSSNLPEYKVHPDDAKLDNEPTLFEEMLNANIEQDSDDEDLNDEEETVTAPLAANKNQKKEQLKKARQAAADCDNDDSDDFHEEMLEEEAYTEK